MQAAARNWIDMPLAGSTSHEFDDQIAGLQPTLNDGWRVRASAKTGNPLYVRPSVLVLYRNDHKFMLDPVIPRPGRAVADYDLVIASQPYRARLPADIKVDKVIAPLTRSRAVGFSAYIRTGATRASKSSSAFGRTRTPSPPAGTKSSTP